jgi:hypothetical protein
MMLMVDLFTGVLYGIAVFQLLLIVLAIYYAYRITRLIGSFWAWSLLILSFVLTLGGNLLSLSLLIPLSEQQIVALLSAVGPAAVWLSQILSIFTSVLLTAAMYGLYQIFKKKKVARPGEQMQAVPLASQVCISAPISADGLLIDRHNKQPSLRLPHDRRGPPTVWVSVADSGAIHRTDRILWAFPAIGAKTQREPLMVRVAPQTSTSA